MARRRATRRLLPAGLGGALALALAALLCPAASRAQTAAERLLDSAAGLEKTLAALRLSEEEARPLTDALRDVGEQARAGRVRLALYRLQSPWALVGTSISESGKAAGSQDSTGLDCLLLSAFRLLRYLF